MSFYPGKVLMQFDYDPTYKGKQEEDSGMSYYYEHFIKGSNSKSETIEKLREEVAFYKNALDSVNVSRQKHYKIKKKH